MRAETALTQKLGIINEEGHNIRWIRKRPDLYRHERVHVTCGFKKTETHETDAATLMKLEIFNERMHEEL